MIRKKLLLLLFLPQILWAQTLSVRPFAEIGTTLHVGDYTPLWQNSMQHGLASVDNNAYLRGGVMARDTLGRGWSWAAGIDLAVTIGMDSHFYIQQAYADISWKCLDLSVGSKEISSNLLNEQLSSGGVVWSGNARPIPQVKIGIFDYTPIFGSSWAAIRGELSYGWWTDNNYLKKQYERLEAIADPWYTKSIKYHHKSFYLRLGKPSSRWQMELGMCLDDQFGGYRVSKEGVEDLGNGLKNYWKALIPQGGDDEALPGEKVQKEGNFLGSEDLRLTYKADRFNLSAYLENYFDDFSGMGKQNGFDGLWGLEYASKVPGWINGVVFEYYQTTNQSGPLHGVDNTDALKTGGADDYYNNYLYQGWANWGQAMANPLIASPVYFSDRVVKMNWGNGYLGFPYNRVKAFHLGVNGSLSSRWEYRMKLTTSRTWGTPFCPTLSILTNWSGFFEAGYYPSFIKDCRVTASVAFDRGDIYGDNLGWQLKIRKQF